MKKLPPIKFEKYRNIFVANLDKIVELTDYLPEPMTRDDITSHLNDKRHWLRTAVDPRFGEVGFSIWYEMGIGKIEYWLTAIHPEHTRRRIGERLLRTALEISKQENYYQFQLTTFNQCHGMIRICKKLGLQEIERKRLDCPYGTNKYSLNFMCDLTRWDPKSIQVIEFPYQETSCYNPKQPQLPILPFTKIQE